MSIAVTPEITALEKFIENLLAHGSGNDIMVAAIQSCWPSDAPNKLLEFFQVLASLEGLAGELANPSMRRIALTTVNGLVESFSPSTMTRQVDWVRQRRAKELHLAQTNLGLFHELTIDRDIFRAQRPEFEAAIDDLGRKFGASSMSDASKSVLGAQLLLLRNSISRFDGDTVGPFRDSAYTIIGRLVIQIHNDQRAATDDKKEMIDDVLRVYDVIEKGSKVLTLGAAAAVLLLKGPA